MVSASPATTARAYDRRYAYGLVGAFAFGWVVLSADMGVFNPVLPLLRAEFQLTGAEAGMLMWVFTLPYLLIQMPSAMLSDRFGSKRLLVGMTLLSALGMIAMGLWSYGLVALVVFAMVQRLGAGVYYPIVFGVTSGAVPATARGTASGTLVMGMALGSALGMGLTIPLYEMGGNNWRFPLLVFGLLTLLLPAIFQLLMRPTQQPKKSSSGSLAAALRNRSLVTLFGMNFCTNYGYTVVMVWGPSFMGSERGLPLGQAGFIIALISLIGFPAGLVSSLASDRIGRRRMAMLLFLVAGGSLASLAVFDEPALMFVAVVTFGLAGKWSSDGVLAAWMGDHVASGYSSVANTVYAVNNSARMLGAMLAPPVTGALLDRTGTLATGFFVGALVLCVAGCVTPLIAERWGSGDDSPK